MANLNRVNQNRNTMLARVDLTNGGGVYPAATVTDTAFAAGSYSATTKVYSVTAAAVDTYDGHDMKLGDRILITGSTTGNGLYECIVEGTVSVAAKYRRAPEMFNSADFIDGATISIRLGTAGKGLIYTASIPASFVLDTGTPAFNASGAAVTETAVRSALSGATGAVSFNGQNLTSVGSVALAANKNVSCAAGTTAVDLSLGTGAFKPPTGIFTFQGKQAATATANVIADPGTGAAIPVTTSGVCMITTAAAETNTLADPTFVGQELCLICDTYAVGDRVVTAANSINQANNTIMTFGAAADMIVLKAMKVGGNLRWRVVANDGVALS